MKYIREFFEFLTKYFKGLLFLLILYLIFSPVKEDKFSKPNLMKIELSGPIMSDEEFLRKIDRAMQDRSIKGVLVEVDSPGGAVGPSVEMSLAIKKLTIKKPVVAYAKGLMASGSYYASIWANKIIANPGSTIGSIGVIFEVPNLQPLTQKIGIKMQVVKAGKYKEIGTPIREWKPFERAELDKVIKNTYKMFVSDVAKARKLDVNNSSQFADAHIFTAFGAKEVGLVDKIGSIYDAKEELKKLSKVKKAIWLKEGKVDKIIDKFLSKLSFTIYSNLFGLKAKF